MSSRKQVASTFSSIRVSVEALIKQCVVLIRYPTIQTHSWPLNRPLKLSDVAELKALLPDVVMFAYISRNERLVHEMLHTQRASSPDFSDPRQSIRPTDESDEILVLDFVDNVKGSKQG